MPKQQRRQSQNSRYMRDILTKLRDYELDEVRLLCEKFRQNQAAKGRRSSRRFRRP